jgi:hypothetical protein
MIRKDKKIYKDGSVKTQIRVVEGYRPGPKLPPKQRTIKDFGYLEDNQDRESFMAMVAEFDAAFKKNASLRHEVPSNASMYAANNRRQNYGYKFLEAVYDSLDIGGFIEAYGKSVGFKVFNRFLENISQHNSLLYRLTMTKSRVAKDSLAVLPSQTVKAGWFHGLLIF